MLDPSRRKSVSSQAWKKAVVLRKNRNYSSLGVETYSGPGCSTVNHSNTSIKKSHFSYCKLSVNVLHEYEWLVLDQKTTNTM